MSKSIKPRQDENYTLCCNLNETKDGQDCLYYIFHLIQDAQQVELFKRLPLSVKKTIMINLLDGDEDKEPLAKTLCSLLEVSELLSLYKNQRFFSSAVSFQKYVPLVHQKELFDGIDPHHQFNILKKATPEQQYLLLQDRSVLKHAEFINIKSDFGLAYFKKHVPQEQKRDVFQWIAPWRQDEVLSQSTEEEQNTLLKDASLEVHLKLLKRYEDNVEEDKLLAYFKNHVTAQQKKEVFPLLSSDSQKLLLETLDVQPCKAVTEDYRQEMNKIRDEESCKENDHTSGNLSK
ncbi:MAG: hypothetical protein ACOYKA_04315 [Legionellaceae bacterium]